MMRKFVSGVNAISNQEGRRPTIWFTNQIRQKTGLVFGNPEVVPGGFAQGFATSTETRTAPKKYKMDDETGEPLSVEMKHRNEKNKTAPAKMEGEYTLILKDTEVKRMGAVKDEDYGIKVGAQLGLVEIGRGWAEYKGVKYDGKSVLERHWMTHPDEYEAFKAEVLSTLRVLRQ
jgi:recombination protein RecA